MCFLQFDISPIEYQLETMIGKNNELQTLIMRAENSDASMLNPLSMALNGVLDASVMGGLSNYEKV